MKKLFFILTLLLPTLIIAQQDSARQTFKIGKCRASVAGVKRGKIDRKKLLSAKKLEVEWCGDSCAVTSFDLAIQYSTKESYALVTEPVTLLAKLSHSEYFTDEMLSNIKKAPRGSTVLITRITYRQADGTEMKLERDVELIIQ
ncbi:MAG: hypothetical protein ACLQQ4_06125 [Bacteroidia bacterium]